MPDILTAAAVFAFIAAVFTIRYLIGERTFWGRKHLKQGYQILLSRRLDACLIDTAALCVLALPGFALCFRGKTALTALEPAILGVLAGFLVLMFLLARSLERVCTFYNEQGLLLSRPFRRLRFVPWSEIGSIRRRNTSAELWNVLDRNGRRLAWFPLNRKTQPFLALAQRNGISAPVSNRRKLVLNTPGKRLNGTLGEWDAALARSAYARHDVIAFAAFQDFMVALFLDPKLSENNVIAINRDGTVRWNISDIVRQPGSYAAMAASGDRAVQVLSVANRRFDGVIYTIDVYAERVLSQGPGDAL